MNGRGFSTWYTGMHFHHGTKFQSSLTLNESKSVDVYVKNFKYIQTVIGFILFNGIVIYFAGPRVADQGIKINMNPTIKFNVMSKFFIFYISWEPRKMKHLSFHDIKIKRNIFLKFFTLVKFKGFVVLHCTANITWLNLTNGLANNIVDL